jgi:hypothetical protein
MAIATEPSKNPLKRGDYKIWYLDIGPMGDVVGIGVKTREELVKELFESFRKFGKTNWRAFKKDADKSSPIEIYDFISQNMHENTHFGNLPTLCEFQETITCLQMKFEVRAIAS